MAFGLAGLVGARHVGARQGHRTYVNMFRGAIVIRNHNGPKTRAFPYVYKPFSGSDHYLLCSPEIVNATK